VALGPLACETPEPAEHADGGRVGRVGRALSAPSLRWKAKLDAPSIDVAPRPDGSLLASTRSAVYFVSPSGNAKPVAPLREKPPTERAILNPSGELFAVARGERLTLHGADGVAFDSAKIGSRDAVRLLPGRKGFVDPVVVDGDDPEGGEVRDAIVFDAGHEVGRFSAPGLRATRPTADNVFFRTGSVVAKTDHKGQPLWSMQVAARLFEPDAAGRHLVLARNDDPRRVAVYEENKLKGDTGLKNPIWNVAMAPGGTFAAACSKNDLAVFTDGVRTGSNQLGEGRPVALAISDQGLALVGYQDPAKRRATVRGFDAKGAELWQIEVPYGEHAYRPDPRFFPNGKGFVVRHEEGLSAYNVEGGS
jgi:hypothetical protein